MNVIANDPGVQKADRTETFSLIASDKVEGTSVFGADREKIGEIANMMIEKRSGKVSYAVLSFGGFLGIGTGYYPLPWHALKYDEELGGYLVGLTADQLQAAPSVADSDDWNWQRAGAREEVDAYYRPMAFI